jgi:hypothetical protein
MDPAVPPSLRRQDDAVFRFWYPSLAGRLELSTVDHSSVVIIAAVDAEGMTSMTSLVTPRDISGL